MINIAPLQEKVQNFINHHVVQMTIVALILLNAILLGTETSADIMDRFGEEISIIDHTILMIFICETILLIFSKGKSYWTDPWCLFDFIVIAIAIVPATESLSVLRALRVLRVLRLINKVQSMKRVVAGLLGSLASLGSVMGLLLIVFYVSAVITTNVFGGTFPDLFGNIGSSFFTLFQVMTLESWSDGIARPIMEKFPYAWIFFILFILIATFVVLNLFVAVIVDSFASITDHDEENADESTSFQTRVLKNIKEQGTEMEGIKEQLAELKELMLNAKDKT